MTVIHLNIRMFIVINKVIILRTIPLGTLATYKSNKQLEILFILLRNKILTKPWARSPGERPTKSGYSDRGRELRM